MSKLYRVAGYVKLAKWWERSREAALAYHAQYYAEKYQNADDVTLVGVYIDITGQKQIYKRPEMLRLMRDCTQGKVDYIAAQTKGYLAANSRDLSYLIKFLFDLPYRIDLVTEDELYRIDTIADMENQREALARMAEEYVALDEAAYMNWKKKVIQAMDGIT